MNQYIFKSTHKTTLIGAMLIGLICMVFTYIGDDQFHTRFWSNILHNATFFTMTAAMALFFTAACITAYAGWYTTFKRVWEAFSNFLVVGLVLLLIIGLGVYMGWHHLYHWADEASVNNDAILQGKSSFLNKHWFFFGTLIFLGSWVFIAYRMRVLSLNEDKVGGPNYTHHKSMKVYAAILLPVLGFSSAALIWQWIMSVDAHWYSTMFAWYTTASAFVAMNAFTILLIIFLQSSGYLKEVNENHIHDLGKYLFAISIFWTYLWFSQYMLIWYANIGEETIYFKERYNNYPILFFGNIAINFLVPFIILMRNDTKRKKGSMVLVSVILVIGHWLDYFLMIKPGALITRNEALAHGAHGDVSHGAEQVAGHGAEHISTYVEGFTLPGFLEMGTFIGFSGLFLYVTLWSLSRAALIPKNDPYLEESLHHHVV